MVEGVSSQNRGWEKREAVQLRILMQNRPNALVQPGGDTVVMEQLCRELRAQGHTVDIDVIGERAPEHYDLVHIFNLVTAEITEAYARRAVGAKVPYVVTSLYEDWPLFFSQMHAQAQLLKHYGEKSRQGEVFSLLRAQLAQVPRRAAPSNAFTMQHAAAVVATGRNEAEALRRDYPNCDTIRTYDTGSQFPVGDSGEQFVQKFGLRDFILCVGRLEPRKNQLMLLSALEHSELPVVLVGGGVTYDEEYAEAVRRFHRKGQTLVLGRLEPDMLASAMAACRIHALPSWYELPGLVSVEAAGLGKNCVVTDYGTARTYLGADAFYCQPDDRDSITNAVVAAYYSPARPTLAGRIKEYTWARAAGQYEQIYREVLVKANRTPKSEAESIARVREPILQQMDKLASEVRHVSASIQSLPQIMKSTGGDQERDASKRCDAANLLAREGRHEEALAQFKEAVRLDPGMSRGYRGCGVMLLLLQRYDEAEEAFRRALVVDPADFQAKTGLGSVLWERGEREQAFLLYREVLTRTPNDPTTIVYFTNAAYAMGRLVELERALEAFIRSEPDNPDINFCLAGCYFKQGKLEDADRVAKHVLRVLPRYPHAVELRELIAKARQDNAAQTVAPLAQQIEVEATPVVRGSTSQVAVVRFVEVESLQKKREYDRALMALAELEQDGMLGSGDRAYASILRGEIFTCMNRLADAALIFRSVESDATYGFRAKSGLGVIAAAEERWTDAEACFSQALRESPHFDVALAGLGICAMKTGDNERAWTFFQQAIQKNPENKRALFGIVQLGYPLNRLKSVEEALAKYLDFNPVDLSMLYSYAGCCYAQGKLEAAERELEKIRLFEPGHTLANELLSRIRTEQSMPRPAHAS